MSNTKNSKNKAPLGLLFWIAFILLILVFFFAQKDVIIPLFQKFSTEVSNPSEAEHKEEIPIVIDNKNDSDGSIPSEEIINTDKKDTEPEIKPDTDNLVISNEEKKDNSKVEVKDEGQTSTKTSEPTASEKPKTRDSNIYFVYIDDNGTIIREKTVREIKKDDSPLTASINALIMGPTAQEQNSGLISLIPNGTKLLSASVKNGTAVLNFNDAFQFNPRGIEGCRGQLMQIVYTATEFSTVQNVQFLIEGQRKEFLGTEGIRLGVPFSRASF